MLTNVRLRRLGSAAFEITGLTPRQRLELRCDRCHLFFTPGQLTIDLDTDECVCFGCFGTYSVRKYDDEPPEEAA